MLAEAGGQPFLSAFARKFRETANSQRRRGFDALPYFEGADPTIVDLLEKVFVYGIDAPLTASVVSIFIPSLGSIAKTFSFQ